MNCPKHVADIYLGKDTTFDAWLYSLLMDNNLFYALNPHLIATQEQLAFMVFLEQGQVYLPCSDATFWMLCEKNCSRELQKQYNRVWRSLVAMIRASDLDPLSRRMFFHFVRLRFRQYTSQHTLIPSRLMKRMTDLLTQQRFSTIEDPWRSLRRSVNSKHKALFCRKEIREALNFVDPAHLSPTISEIRQELNGFELIRLFVLTLIADTWEKSLPDSRMIRSVFAEAEERAKSIVARFSECGKKQETILFLADAEGSTFFEVQLIHALLRMGNKVIYAVKNAHFFLTTTLLDISEDPVLEEICKDAKVITDLSLSKNELLKALKAHKFLIISDGTRERLNLYRVSVTFSRSWKEADCVLASGWRAKDILLGTSHTFTRDIVCFWLESDGFHIEERSHAEKSHKISEQYIRSCADAIIATMREAHREKRIVMFFSCIIGSIPGETALAICLAKTFVNDLRSKLENVYIINPAEHFVDGMDGDDLMYMWERVQRSGEIDIWRFQSSEDIEQSFSLLGRKIPPIWSGKDSTYSTGCTKEMKIALDVQQSNPEMQIIGPDPKRFFRRGEYGIGKYFDALIRR